MANDPCETCGGSGMVWRNRAKTAGMTCLECNGSRIAGEPLVAREPDSIDDEPAGSWSLAVASIVVSEAAAVGDRERYQAEAVVRFSNPEVAAAWVKLRMSGIDMTGIVGASTAAPCATCDRAATVFRPNRVALCFPCHNMTNSPGTEGPSIIVTPLSQRCNKCDAAHSGGWPPSCCDAWADEPPAGEA